ncbi:MAG: sugar transferase [Gallionella sp.]|jgi:lipopolysaccharide/colanic/teichoic acid biosynthesis glycosyltransferase|nr:sugar transferase [Gallionella sp.]MCK9353555.1 sugar transferase [Gallionella sp.]
MVSQIQIKQDSIPEFREARQAAKRAGLSNLNNAPRRERRSTATLERNQLWSACYRFSKRWLDLVLGSILLCCSLPIIVMAAIAVRMESRGNPIFIQTRVGQNGKPFRIFKLRGMYADARARFPELYDYSKHGSLDFHFHYEQDPRITRVGNFIRRTSIDELPNFLNVVLGSMTLVGPRPEIPDVSALYGEYREQYLAVKPGITCLSKVSGRDLLTKEQTIRMDIAYIENRSTAVDLKILWATFWSVINRKNVFGRSSNIAKSFWLSVLPNSAECNSEACEEANSQ